MNRLFITALAAALLAAPLANAQEWPKNHNSHGQPPHSHGKAPPRGPSHGSWGPHRGPDRPGYYHGYHGYHDRRPGYRRHSDGLWYPAAAFAIGAIIGGALNN